MQEEAIDKIKDKYKVIGFNERLYTALDTALQVAPTDLSVLIQGESGVGKEVIPRIIHDHSPRKMKKYIAINCGSIPEGTIDSELFGHEKGSFTGAVGEHDGYFAAADGGTLFLDEVGELPMSTQARLLRVLETGEYIRVGSNEPRKTNVRIVAATNVQIQKAIREGKFREDLYYRLCTISIKMPPLRERGDDVVRLFKFFAMVTAQKYNITNPVRLTPEAERVMMSYKWPGNIRQLRNLTEQMSILCSERVITPEVLERYDVVPNGASTEMATLDAPHTGHFDYDKERAIIFAMLNQLGNDVKALKDGLAGNASMVDDRFSHGHILEGPQSTSVAIIPENTVQNIQPHVKMDEVNVVPTHYDEVSVASHFADADADAELVDDESDLNLERIEKKAIEEALKRNRNRRKQAAVDLGISERTLYRKIKDYGLEE